MNVICKIGLSAALALSFGSVASAVPPCTSFTCMPKDGSEIVEVTGERIRSFGLNDLDYQLNSLEMRTPGTSVAGSGPASKGEVNTKGKKKAKKAKDAAAKGQSSWWNPGKWIADGIQGLQVHVNGWFHVQYFDENGTKRLDAEGCLNNSVNKENKESCSKVETGKTPDGKNIISIHKLIAVKHNGGHKLVYSTDDTITFVFESEEELVSLIREVDPDFSI